MQFIKSLLLVLLTSQSIFASYYLPGVHPNYYEQGDKVYSLLVIAIYSFSYDFSATIGFS
jgi:hypothetical protein